MTKYETFSICIALISAIIAVISLKRTREVAIEQLHLEKIMAELAKKQISQIENAELEKVLPNLRVDLTKLGNNYHFLISNRGEGSAYDLSFALVNCADSPVSNRELNEKFPFPELRADSRIKLLASIHMQSPRKYLARLTWSDANGEKYSEEFHVTV
ncbi:hypothetical protein [Gimesia maris]|uniref:hypothetical protein n=1 Tax=Gimesia maris TaxID=122 RepID=UPI003A8D61C9